ncbi:MAG: hypothetical protein JNK25_11250 [Phycisphaerae bacterium]|nr:hypothetical protein [Phycisphaerae bacterium]
MNKPPHEPDQFESSRQLLLNSSVKQLTDVFADRFEEDFPSDVLYAGGFLDRLRGFVLNRVRVACDAAGRLGAEVWEALHDERTAHNMERFALVCGFFASKVLNVGHWPAHEIAALVLLLVTYLPKGGSGRP